MRMEKFILLVLSLFCGCENRNTEQAQSARSPLPAADVEEAALKPYLASNRQFLHETLVYNPMGFSVPLWRTHPSKLSEAERQSIQSALDSYYASRDRELSAGEAGLRSSVSELFERGIAAEVLLFVARDGPNIDRGKLASSIWSGLKEKVTQARFPDLETRDAFVVAAYWAIEEPPRGQSMTIEDWKSFVQALQSSGGMGQYTQRLRQFADER